MNRRSYLMSYAPMADFIARMNGPKCEVLIHNAQTPEHSVLYITQPSLTDRRVGDGMTDYAVELIERGRYREEPFVVNYVGGTEERIFRSSTYFIMDGEELAGLLCVNVDIGDLLRGRAAMEEALLLDPSELSLGKRESFRLGSTAEEQIEQVLSRYAGARAPSELSTAEKRAVTHALWDRGVFNLKGQVGQVAGLLGVSEKTLYRYLKDCEN